MSTSLNQAMAAMIDVRLKSQRNKLNAALSEMTDIHRQVTALADLQWAIEHASPKLDLVPYLAKLHTLLPLGKQSWQLVERDPTDELSRLKREIDAASMAAMGHPPGCQLTPDRTLG